jgi:hypothetical protein
MDMAKKSGYQAFCFLIALLSKAAEVISDLKESREASVNNDMRRSRTRARQDLVKEFRQYMSEGQSMVSPGHKRSVFYEQVIIKAKEVCYASSVVFRAS